MANHSRIAFCASCFFFLTTHNSFLRGQDLDQLSNAIVGIDVFNSTGANQENGTGFVVSVDRSTITVLTARHVFYPAKTKERFQGKVSVTFFVDRHKEYAAELLDDSAPLDLAVLRVENVPLSISARLPMIPVRPDSTPPSITDGLRIFGGKPVDWLVTSGTVSGGDKSAEGLQYTANALEEVFSGSPLFDSNGLLLGVHVRTGEHAGIGRATRIDHGVYEVLSVRMGVTMNKLNFNVIPNMPTPISGGSAAARPEAFGRIDVNARMDSLPWERKPGGKWKLTVYALTPGGNYYDVHVQAVLKGVGTGSQSTSAPDLRPAGSTHVYSARVDELGKSAVVCFTGTKNPSAPRPQRLTAWFNIDVNGNVATFSPSRPAALEPASENPCDPDPTAPVESAAKMVHVQQAAPEQGLPNAAPRRPSGRQADAVDMAPANFAAIQVVASLRQQKWSLTVNALSGGLRQRDTSLQVMVLDATDHLKALPLSKKTLAGATYTNELIDELGKGVVVCYTSIDDSAKGQAFRMTSWFATEVQGNRAKFVPVRPAVITQASDVPCQ